MAWQRYVNTKCPNCGTIPDDWLNPDGSRKDVPPYVPDTAHCEGCATLGRHRGMIPDARRDSDLVFLRPNVERLGRGL